MQRFFLSLIILCAMGAIFVSMSIEQLSSHACRDVGDGLALCASSDMAKLSDHGRVPLDHPDYAIANGALRLHAARNETIAFQLYLQNLGDAKGAVTLSFDDFSSDKSTLKAHEICGVKGAGSDMSAREVIPGARAVACSIGLRVIPMR